MTTVTGRAVIGGTTYEPTATITLPATPAGFPSAATTGYQGTLAAYTGPSRITSPTVIEGKRITSPLIITASAATVTIRNCLIRSDGYWMILNDEGARLIVEDTELDGTPGNGDSAVAGYNYTLTRCNIHHCVDGVKAGSNVTIQDSYIHDLLIQGADPHNDGIQSLGTTALTIRRNTIIVKDGATSCVILSTGSASAMRNITIEDNLLGGGAFVVYGGYEAGRDDVKKVSNIVIRNNRITTQIFPRGGAYGPFTSVSAPAVTMAGNTWHDGPKAGQPAT